MVKCAIFPLRALKSHFNAFLLVRVIFILDVGHQQCHQSPYQEKRCRQQLADFVSDIVFHCFSVFEVDFLLVLRYLESPDGTLQRCGQKAAASKLGTNAVLPVSRLRVMSGAFLFRKVLIIVCLPSRGDGF